MVKVQPMMKQGKNILFITTFLLIAGQNDLLLAGSYTPCIERPVISKPNYEKPAFPKPDFAKPNYEKQIIEKPVVIKDQYERPKIDAPSFVKPKFQDCAAIKAIQTEKDSAFVPSAVKATDQSEKQQANSQVKKNLSATNSNYSLYFYNQPSKQSADIKKTDDEECCGGNLNLKEEKNNDKNVVVMPRRILVR